MHELFIAQSIINTVKDSLSQGLSTEAVRVIHVCVGKLDAVIPDNLIFLFNAIKESFDMKDAKLTIENEDIKCKCNSCGSEFILGDPIFICPFCQSSNINVITGRGIRLTKIIVDD